MKARSTGSGGFRAAYYMDDDFMFNDDDIDYIPPARKKTAPIGGGGKERPGLPKRPAAQSPPPGAGGQSISPSKAVRSRPTNNQLLYKAYFRWAHYPHKLKNANLPDETDACASVTAAFLQVLQIMQTAEQLRHGNNKRNVLQILSSNTRRTKVVELSSGTHRVPDELKKHYLSDGEGGQYSTNLDRNRYGNDDNYLFTVIRYDLEFLGLCPCMVDVEIIDAKQGNTSIIVSAGTEVCNCQGGPSTGGGAVGAPAPVGSGGAPASAGGTHHHLPPSGGGHMHHLQSATLSGGGHPQIKPEYPGALSAPSHVGAGSAGATGGGSAGYGGGGAAVAVGPHDVGNLTPLFGSGTFRGAPQQLPGGMGSSRESPKRSGTSVSQLFDALVMAATGGADGAAAAEGMGGEPPVTSPAHADRPDRGLGGGGTGVMGSLGAPRCHGPPGRNKSKMWSLNNLSYGGEVDSLQNALDAFREQDEIASGDPAAFLTSGASAGGLGPDGSLQRSDSLRQRRRKPLRNSSILGRPASSGGLVPLGSKVGTNLREKSDDNLKLTVDPDLDRALAAGLGGGSFHVGGGMALGHGATQVSSLVSGEDDNDGGAGDADADDALAAKGEDLGMEGEGEAGGEEDLQEDGAVGCGGGRGAGGAGGGAGPTASGTVPRSSNFLPGRGPLRHHARHVPRQSSVANLGPRAANSSGGGGAGANGGGGGGAAGSGLGALGLGMLGPSGLGGSASAAIAGEQLRRLAHELEVMRHENRSLRQQLQRANSSNVNGNGNGGGGPGGSPSVAGKQSQRDRERELTQREHNSENPGVNNDSARLRKLETELSSMRNELLGLSNAKKSADEENKQLKRDLLSSQQQVVALLRRMLGAAEGLPGFMGAATSPLSAASSAGILASLLGSSAAAPVPGASTQPFQSLGDPSSLPAYLMALRYMGPVQRHQSSGSSGEGAAGTEVVGGMEPARGPQESFEALMAAIGDARLGEVPNRRSGATGDVMDLERNTQPQARKRTADEAGLAAAAAAAADCGDAASAPGTEVVFRRGGAAAAVGAPASATAPQEMGPGTSQRQLQQLMSMPSLAPTIPMSLGMFPRPADSGPAGTPSDSNFFSDVAQLLALPNLDSTFTSSELAAPYGGGGSSGGVGNATLAATSGVQLLAGSGSGSGTASVPQMPQSEQQMLLTANYGLQHGLLR